MKIPYKVTKESKNREFQVGDTIYFCEDGSILCAEAGGWIPKESVPEATAGLKYEVNSDWVSARISALEAEIVSLRGLIK